MGEGITLFSFFCRNCGYRGFDVFPERMHGPRILEFKVRKKEHLNVLVARSSTATVKIPEIGAEIKPGPASFGFITTVEGILLRMRDVFSGNERAVELIDELLSGKEFTLIIEDPFGTSAIDSAEVVVREMQKSFKTP